MKVEQEVHRGDDGGHDTHQQGPYEESQGHFEGHVQDIPAVGFVVQGFLADDEENQSKDICDSQIPSRVLGSPEKKRYPKEPRQDIRYFEQFPVPAEFVKGIEQDKVRKEPGESLKLIPENEYQEISDSQKRFHGKILKASCQTPE